MVGFARAVSDGVALAYLADVFVAESVRGCGVAKAMLSLMINDGPGADFRWMLHNLDAHRLYRSFGFTEPTRPPPGTAARSVTATAEPRARPLWVRRRRTGARPR
jgi:hypothetical protein